MASTRESGTEGVCFQSYRNCQHDSLEEALQWVVECGNSIDYNLTNIVFNNKRYRDCLRQSGMDALIARLKAEAPMLEQEETALAYLRNVWEKEMMRMMGDYDIQCLPTDATFRVGDSLFYGLADVERNVEAMMNIRDTWSGYSRRTLSRPRPNGLHVGNLWQSYPTFDSCDSGDGRSYNNYVFSDRPISKDFLWLYTRYVNSNNCACMVHEFIPTALLPILYWDGNSSYMLLATKKTKKGGL